MERHFDKGASPLAIFFVNQFYLSLNIYNNNLNIIYNSLNIYDNNLIIVNNNLIIVNNNLDIVNNNLIIHGNNLNIVSNNLNIYNNNLNIVSDNLNIINQEFHIQKFEVYLHRHKSNVIKKIVMITRDYIPVKDVEFNRWQNDFSSIVKENAVRWEISETAVARIKEKADRWNTAYAKAGNEHNRTRADVVEKKEARTDYVKELRLFVKRHLAFNEAIIDAERKQMGLTIPSGHRSAPPVPDSMPVVEVDFSIWMQHTLRFRDHLTEGRAKPDKVLGCEIWSKIGEKPVNADELTFHGVDTRSPHTIRYDGDQRGKTVWYWLRWINSRGEQGPWSVPVSAIIA